MFLNENNCKFYDKYFIDDLYPYKFNGSDSTITYYNNGGILGSSPVDMSKAISTINFLSNNNTENDVWIPAFINLNTSQANSRVLFRGATSFNENLGVENAVVIKNPLFQNWNISNGNMVSDWILTADIIPFSPRYGILFWYKNSSLVRQSILPPSKIPYNAIASPIQDYRYGNITISTNTRLAKKDNDTFYILDSDNPKVAEFPIESVSPSKSTRYFKISKLLLQTEYKDLKKEDILFQLYDRNSLIPSKPYLSIWIPAGETYSYYRSKEEEQELKVTGTASSSYLSPILSNIYREIYHVLTLRYPKNFAPDDPHRPVPFFSTNESKLIKKLAYCLATAPQMDRTTVSLLNTDIIYDIIQSYLRANNENQLYPTLILISKEMSKLVSSSNLVDNQSYQSGLVDTTEQLFYKLISKYGSKIRLFGKASISYKEKLKYGPHVKINQDIISRCDSSLRDQTVFNNVKFNVGEFEVKSQMGPDVSKLILSNNRKKGVSEIIPLWDVVKKDLKQSRLPITAGPDIEVNFDDDKLLARPSPQTTDIDPEENQENRPQREIKIELKEAIADVGGGFFDPNILGGEEIDVLWTRVSGPDCLKFSNNRLSRISGQGLGGSSFIDSGRYATSTDSNPILYIKQPGRYVVQLRVKASFGVLYDNVVVHVVSQANEPTYERQQGLAPAKIQYLKPENGLVVMVPNIRECYFGKQGVFWISYCDASVKLPATVDPQENVNNLPQTSITALPEVVSLGNNYHKFGIPMLEDNDGNKSINHQPVYLFISYDCNNTTIDLSHITLTNLMDNNSECYNCESLYEGILDSDGFLVDSGSGGTSFLDPSNKDQFVTLEEGLDDLTTSRTLVKSYGGFSQDVVDSFGVRIPFHPGPGQLLPNITGTKELLNEPKGDDNKVQHICHDTDVQHDASIVFSKGCFHPNYGWIENKKYNNQSAVLRFNPYHRPVQSFKGPGMYDLTNDFSDGKPKIYRSSIAFRVDKIAHDPVITNPDNAKQVREAAEKAEMSDHIDHYGYKSIGGNVSLKDLALNDEYIVNFPVEDDAPVSSADYCSDKISESSYTASYSFSRPGTHIPVKLRSSDPIQRWNREGASSIGNIEVKINFLNYINPKDLVVWLEIDACGQASQALNPPADDSGDTPPPKDSWYDGSYAETYGELSKLPDGEMKNYLYGLWKLNNNDLLDSEDRAAGSFSGNSKPKMGGVYRVYLLNRDHISSSDYNINLKFSDLLDLDKFANNHNISSTLYIDNNISQSINNTIDLAPTLSAAGYSDEQIYKYKKIIIENKLLNNSHSFRKISGMPLFAPAASDAKIPPAANSSSTTFTLCVAIVGESDTFEPYDRVANSEQMCGFDSCILKNRSSLVANSICSWELILHRDKNNLGFVPGDALGSIRYESEPDIPGHNFIADLSDKLHLLPPTVLNSPNAYLLDGRLCRYSKEVLNQPTYLPPPPMNISPITFAMPASAVAAVAAVAQVEAGMNEQTRQIVNWLGAKRRAEQKELFNRAWFVPVYDKYPYGGYDKALLSVSKDGQLFYKMEAAIFRYNNSIVMKKNKHYFCKLHYKSFLKSLSIFKPQKIPVNKNVINSSTLFKLLKPYIKTYKNLGEAVSAGVDDRDIIRLKTPPQAETEEFASLPKERQDIILQNNIFVVVKEAEGGLSYIQQCSFSTLLQNEKLACSSNMQDLVKNPESLEALILSNRLAYIKGLRPYHFFLNNKDITTFDLKKNLSEEETKKIDNLDKQIEEERKKLKKISDPLLQEKVHLIINSLENELFDIRHISTINKISNIGYIFDGSNYNTIIIFSNTCNSTLISLSPGQSKRIVVYNKDNSTVENNKTKNPAPIDLWFMHNPSQPFNISPEIQPVCWGAGNYGYGGNAVNLNQISSQNIQNKIISLADRLDSRKNSKIDLNSFRIFYEFDRSIFSDGSISSLGYSYGPNDRDLLLNDNIDYEHSDKNIKALSKKIFEDFNQRVYLNSKNLDSFVELDIGISNDRPALEKGIIEFSKDIQPTTVYGFDGDYQTNIDVLKNRLKELMLSIKHKNKSKKTPKNYKNLGQPSELDIQNNELRKLIQEKHEILYYLDLLERKDTVWASIPQVLVSVTKAESGGLSFKEKINDNYYWINIDPEQGCSIDKDRTVKILKEVTFLCVLYNDQYTRDADQICGGRRVISGSLRGKDEDIGSDGVAAKYTLSEASIKKIKNSYPDLVWPENDTINFITERKFFLNLHGKERAQQVIAKYKYIVPLGPAEPDIPPDGDVKNKVYNIFNLDNTNNLFIEFKRIPRAIKGVDTQYEIFEPDTYGNLTKSTTPPEGGPIDASLRMWKCLDPQTGSYIKPPPYYNWLNEMIFRLYFGSADGVEYQGRNTTKSKDIMYWIPYDYS